MTTPEKPPQQADSDRRYTPEVGEAQLTVRAVVAGCLIGSVVSCTNIYIGLTIGWTFGASIISAVLAFSLFSMLGKNLSVLETNITQTAGSAAGSMASAAGLVAAIPALQMLGLADNLHWYTLMAWTFSIAFLGVFFAVPLRRQVVEIDKLRFPTGTATAETILAMKSQAGDALAKARLLIWAGAGAGLFALAAHFVPQLGSPPIHKWIAAIEGWFASGPPTLTLSTGDAYPGMLSFYFALAAMWTFKLYLGPALFGAGFLIGPRVSISLLLGAVVSWALLGPYAQSAGWAPGAVMSYSDGPRGWLLWPGVALMVAEALTALVLSWKTFVRALTMSKGLGDDSSNKERIPNSWWIGGLCVGTVLTATVAYLLFGIAPYLSVIAIALSSVLSIVAVRSTGETDINPVGGMGKVTQLVFGGLAPGAQGTNLMCAGITGAGASQAADMMQDLKTGYLLGASPRKQFIAQLIGICAGVVFVVPVYYLFQTAYTIGGEKLPAPAAMAWKAMAELLAQGFDALPPHATTAVAIAGAVGVLLPIIRRIDAIKAYVPSGLAMGIAFIVPAYYSLVIFFGFVIWFLWKKIHAESVSKYDFIIASGLVAGEGLMGIVNAGLTILEVPTLGG